MHHHCLPGGTRHTRSLARQTASPQHTREHRTASAPVAWIVLAAGAGSCSSQPAMDLNDAERYAVAALFTLALHSTHVSLLGS